MTAVILPTAFDYVLFKFTLFLVSAVKIFGTKKARFQINSKTSFFVSENHVLFILLALTVQTGRKDILNRADRVKIPGGIAPRTLFYPSLEFLQSNYR